MSTLYLRGEDGEFRGIRTLRGGSGKSAYQYAQDGGYSGTEKEFAEKLAAEYLDTDVPVLRYDPQTLTAEQQAVARGNIGAASAENVSQLSDKIEREIEVSWTQGGILESTGLDDDNKTRIKSDYIELNNRQVISCNPTYKLRVLYYDSAKNYIKKYDGYSSNLVVMSDSDSSSAVRYIRLTAGKKSDEGVTPDEFIVNAGFKMLESHYCHEARVRNIINDKLSAYNLEFIHGGYHSSSGATYSTTSRCRTQKMLFDKKIKIIVSAEYPISLFFYSGTTFLGSGGSWMSGLINLADYTSLNVDRFAILARHLNDREILPEELEDFNRNIILYTDDSPITFLQKPLEERLKAVEADLLSTKEYTGVYNWDGVLTKGTIDSNTGTAGGSSTRMITNAIPYSKNVLVTCSDNLRAYIHFYSSENYIVTKSGWRKSIALSEFSQHNPDSFRLVLSTDNDDTVTSEIIEAAKKSLCLSNTNSMLYNLLKGEEGTNYILPVLAFNGNTSGMTKDNAVTLEYSFNGMEGTCECKWQGSSSVRLGYPKRNYTIKFDNAFEAKTGWGAQKKYCAKANWVDPSGARNVVNARLWGQVVASRQNAVTDGRATAPNYGAIDGFPVVITINGEYEGLYTFNIPKDGWMFNMGEEANEYVVCSESNTEAACLFKGLAVIDENDYSIEYKPDEINDVEVVNSFNTLLQAAIEAQEDWETTLSPYLDIDSVVDYFIFVNCIGGNDNLGKNILYGTYDGTKWFMSAYDLDTTYGSNPYGMPKEGHSTAWYKVVNNRNQFKEAASMHKLARLVYQYSPARLKTRYKELRKTVLSDENVWWMLTNFVNEIPRRIYNMDAEKWITMPATSTANIATYMNFYRMHCAYLDKEVDALPDAYEG